jgi:hypothetical protein
MKNRVGEWTRFTRQCLGLERVPKRMPEWEEEDEARKRTPKSASDQKAVFDDWKTRKPQSGSRERPKTGVR